MGLEGGSEKGAVSAQGFLKASPGLRLVPYERLEAPEPKGIAWNSQANRERERKCRLS